MSSDAHHLGGHKYANWFAGPVRDDGGPRQKLQITVPNCAHQFTMEEADELYRFLESYRGWMLSKLEPTGCTHEAKTRGDGVTRCYVCNPGLIRDARPPA